MPPQWQKEPRMVAGLTRTGTRKSIRSGVGAGR
jgi:hypothetical protein